MADLLTEITAHLATAASLVVGTTLFRGGLPVDGSTTVSAIFPTGGLARGETPLRQQTFQVITRGADLDSCNAQATAIYNATLDARKVPKLNVALATLTAKKIEPMQPPADIGIDAAGRRRTSFNILVIATE